MLLAGIVWLFVIGAAIVALVVVAGIWGGLSYKDAVLFEDELEAEHFPTDHVHVPPPIDIPLDPREDDDA